MSKQATVADFDYEPRASADIEHDAYRLSKQAGNQTFVVFVKDNNDFGLVGVQLTPRQMHAQGYYAKRPPVAAYYNGDAVPYEMWPNYGA